MSIHCHAAAYTLTGLSQRQSFPGYTRSTYSNHQWLLEDGLWAEISFHCHVGSAERRRKGKRLQTFNLLPCIVFVLLLWFPISVSFHLASMCIFVDHVQPVLAGRRYWNVWAIWGIAAGKDAISWVYFARVQDGWYQGKSDYKNSLARTNQLILSNAYIDIQLFSASVLSCCCLLIPSHRIIT